MSKEKILIGVSLFVAIVSLVFSFILYISMPKYVVFDVKTTTNVFLKQVSDLNISTEQKSAIVQRYNKALEQVMAECAADNEIVLVKNAVVSKNIEDKTADIKKRISKKMKDKN